MIPKAKSSPHPSMARSSISFLTPPRNLGSRREEQKFTGTHTPPSATPRATRAEPPAWANPVLGAIIPPHSHSCCKKLIVTPGLWAMFWTRSRKGSLLKENTVQVASVSSLTWLNNLVGAPLPAEGWRTCAYIPCRLPSHFPRSCGC